MYYRYNNDGFFTVMTVVVVILSLAAAVVGSQLATNRERTNAIEAGVAEYVVDAKTGLVEFRYEVSR